MSNAPRDALIVTQYYRPEILGSGPYCADIAEWLTQRGRRVTVIAGPPHYPNSEAFESHRMNAREREVIAGVRVERIRSHVPATSTVAARIGAEISFFLAGIGALLSGRVRRESLVISLCPSILSVAVGVLARGPRGRHVALIHDIQSGLAGGLNMVRVPGFVAAMRLCERIVLNRADLIAVLTPEMADQLRRIGVITPIEILPIWVDIDRFVASNPSGRGAIRVLYSGNLGRKQGLDQIVALARELKETRPDIVIVVRGHGNQAASLRSEVDAQGLHNVRLEGLLAHDAHLRGLADVDIHIVPQAPDAAPFALPSKIFNIMASGRPFVATARNGSPLWRICESSGAFVCVPPGDSKAFAHAIVTLADDADLRTTLGERGRQFVAQNNARANVLGRFQERLDALYAS